MKTIVCSFVWILTATVLCCAQNNIYLPQIADGTQSGGIVWTTAIVVTNPAATGTAAASGAITFRQSSGAAFNIAFTDPTSGNPVGSGNTLSFQLAGGQTAFFISGGSDPLNVGFGTVTSSLPVTVGAVFQESIPGGTTTFQGMTSTAPSNTYEAGVAAVSPVARQAIAVVQVDSTNTAVAIANPSSSAATVTFQLLTTAGVAAFPAKTISLGANSQTAQYVNQLFPNISSTFFGTMQITSGTPLAATSLLFNGDGSFATLPVITLASLINPAVEWFDRRSWPAPLASFATLLGDWIGSPAHSC